jgi:solute carrier family 25 S-adenosylmethionine transporter 26
VKAFNSNVSLLSRSQFPTRKSLLKVHNHRRRNHILGESQHNHDRRKNNGDFDSKFIISRRNALLTSATTFIALSVTVPTDNCNAMVSTSESQTMDTSILTSNIIATRTNTELNNTPPPPSPIPSLTTLQETISGFVSGATITTTKTLVKYPLDTATVRLQMKSTPYSIFNLYELFNGSYNGITTPLVSNIPAGALFFAIKDAMKSILKSTGKEYGVDIPKWVSTCIAVGVATPPYWLLRNPSEVIKTRQQVGTASTTSNNNGEAVPAWEAIQSIFRSNHNNTVDTIKDLYSGFSENILYGYPADVIKFVAYEALSSSSFSSTRKDNGNITPLYGALYGAGATAIAQFLTTPLDGKFSLFIE